MSLKNEEDSSIKPRDLVFLLAIAGRIDAQNRLLAQELDKNRLIYHAYAVCDSLSSTYSMLKYIMEVFLARSGQDALQEILSSPGGITAVAGGAVFLVGFALLASYFDGKDNNNALKRFIVASWPYFRDVMKGLKNAYKGWKSTVQIVSMLGGVDIKYLLVPVGLALGIIAAANRFWLRYMVENRKVMMGVNAELLLSIQKLASLTPEEREVYLEKISYQNENERIHAFFAVGLGGFIDGLYLYAGVISLAVLAPPAYIAMAVVCAIYTVACVVSRIYEEYDFQLRLVITQNKCKLELIAKQLETTYNQLRTLQDKVGKTVQDQEDISRLKKEVLGLIEEFEQLRNVLKNQTMRTYGTSALLGLKHGLFAYGVLASILFMTVSLFSITAVAFPPALLIACIVSGLAFIIGMGAYTIKSHQKNLQKQKKEEEEPFHKLVVLKEQIKTDLELNFLTADEFNKSLKDGVKPKTPAQFFFQEWFEVLRSFFSGLSKGNNFATFASTPFQGADPKEHGHDSPVMTMVMMASSALFAIILALRALARGFGRTPLGNVPPVSTKPEPSLRDNPATKASGESRDFVPKVPPDSRISRSSSFLNFANFFRPSPVPRLPLPRSRSADVPLQSTPVSSLHRVQGLT